MGVACHTVGVGLHEGRPWEAAGEGRPLTTAGAFPWGACRVDTAVGACRERMGGAVAAAMVAAWTRRGHPPGITAAARDAACVHVSSRLSLSSYPCCSDFHGSVDVPTRGCCWTGRAFKPAAAWREAIV